MIYWVFSLIVMTYWVFSLIFMTYWVFFLQELLTLHFSGTKLDKKDFLGKSDPFLIFYKANEDNRFVLRIFFPILLCFLSFKNFIFLQMYKSSKFWVKSCIINHTTYHILVKIKTIKKIIHA